VTAEGQTEELQFKVEKHYFPQYELVVSMPMFILDTDEAIEASVDGTYLTERMAAGNIILRCQYYISFLLPIFSNSNVP
jgi:hypothetical protein